jgi:hypothetical protein
MEVFFLTTLPKLIMEAEKAYTDGSSKKQMVIKSVTSLTNLTDQQKQILEPLLSTLIDYSVKLMSESAMLNKRFCFRTAF